MERGDAARARPYLREALALAREATAHEDTIAGLECRAGIALLEGDHELAATMVAAIEAACAATGVTQPPPRRSEHERRLHALRETLGDAAFARAWEAGAHLSLEESATLALRETPHDGEGQARTSAHTRASASPLTPREQEIAVLIAQGLSNREIAGRLVISTRTADTHVANILSRLGLSVRAQVAVWAAERGLLAASPD